MAGDEQRRPDKETGDGLRGSCHQEHRLFHGCGAALGDFGDAGRGCRRRGRHWIWGQCGPPHCHGARQQGLPERSPGSEQGAGLHRGNHRISLLPARASMEKDLPGFYVHLQNVPGLCPCLIPAPAITLEPASSCPPELMKQAPDQSPCFCPCLWGPVPHSSCVSFLRCQPDWPLLRSELSKTSHLLRSRSWSLPWPTRLPSLALVASHLLQVPPRSSLGCATARPVAGLRMPLGPAPQLLPGPSGPCWMPLGECGHWEEP